MYNAKHTVVYIGKAKVLRNRIRQYFYNSITHPKTRLLQKAIRHIDFIVTKTEADALVLEKQLIQKHQPMFNIDLKDDKNFPVIRLLKSDPFPRLGMARDMSDPGYQYYGPFPSMGPLRQFFKLIHALFPIRDCHQPIDPVKPQPKCIKLDIGTCLGPCVNKACDYTSTVKALGVFLNGNHEPIIKQLTDRMTAAAAAKQYEKAAIARDHLATLNQLKISKTVQLPSKQCHHIWGFYQKESLFYAVIQTVNHGKLISQRGRYTTDDTGIYADLTQFIRQTIAIHYHDYTGDVRHILLDSTAYQAIETDLETSIPASAQVSVPKRGVKKDMVDAANRNAMLSSMAVDFQSVKRESDQNAILEALKTDLSLTTLPTLIFGFDSSHFRGDGYVGSAVCFFEGAPDKSRYRRFQIKTVTEESNDPKSIYELVSRRLQLCLRSHEPLPDLCMVDGGKAQLHAGQTALYDAGLHNRIHIIALAKKEELIYSGHLPLPIQLGTHHEGRYLIQCVRDEAHRFARAYQRLKQRKSLLND